MVANELVQLRWSLVVEFTIESKLKSTLDSMFFENVSA